MSDAPVGDPAGGVLLEQTFRHSAPPERLAYPGPLSSDSCVVRSRCAGVGLTRRTFAVNRHAAPCAPTQVPDLVCSLDVLPNTGSGQAPRGGHAEEEDPELSAT